jgi:hypothetical protein
MEHDWLDIKAFPPPVGQYCEYRILLTCRGVVKDPDPIRFKADEEVMPMAEITAWRLVDE